MCSHNPKVEGGVVVGGSGSRGCLSLDDKPPSSLLAQEIMVRLKMIDSKMCKILFILSPISSKEEGLKSSISQNYYKQIIDSIRYNRVIVILISCMSRLFSLEVRIYKSVGFYLEGV